MFILPLTQFIVTLPKPKTQIQILDPSLVTISRNEKLLIITPYSLRNVIHREAANEFLEDDMLWFYSLMKPYYMMIDKLTFFIGHSSEKKDYAWWNEPAYRFKIFYHTQNSMTHFEAFPSNSYISEEWSFFVLFFKFIKSRFIETVMLHCVIYNVKHF